MLDAKRPDIKIVGDELHPLLKITDFSPYIAKIKASGADTVVTGNWGQDFALLLKAAADAGLKVNWYTYYAGGAGGPTAVKQADLDHQVFQITEGFANLDNAASQEFEKAIPRQVRLRPVLSARRQRDAHARGRGREGQSRSIRSRSRTALEGMEFEVLRRRQGHHAQGRPPVLPADVHLLARRAHRKRSRSTRKRPVGAGGWSRRSNASRPSCRRPARWNGPN